MMDETDDAEEAAFDARYRERRHRMVTRPPRCVAPFAPTPASAADLPGVAFDGHGSPDESIFRLHCPCGGQSFRVRGTLRVTHYRGTPEDFFGDPLELTCPTCNRTQLLFDARQHGYNADIESDELLPAEGQRDADRTNEGHRTDYACPACGGHAVNLWTRFEHHAETCEDSFAERLSEGRESDFFTWLTLLGRCAKCGRLQTVTEFECA